MLDPPPDLSAAPPPPESESLPTPAETPSVDGRRRRVIITSVGVVGLLAMGGALGWRIARRTYERPVNRVEVVVPPRSASEGAGSEDVPLITPDVIGLDVETARAAVLDAGFAADAVTTREVDHTAAAGTVIRQDPSRGARDPKTVVLDVARSGSMPDLAGRTLSEASNELRARGVSISTRYVTAGAAAGTVLSTDPPAGQPLTVSATVVAVAPAESLPLVTVRPETMQCENLRAGAQIAGGRTGTGFQCSAPTSGSRQISYLLTAGLDRVSATVGILDSSPPGSSAGLDVVIDGSVAQHHDLIFGKSASVDVAIGGHVSMAFVVSAPATPNPSGGTAVVGIAKPRVSGSADAITAFIEPR